MVVFGKMTYAQESQDIPESGEYHLVVDQALDKVEENIHQANDEIPSVEILEEINLVNGGETEEIHETKIIPLLHAEASGIIEALEQMKSPAGKVTYNEEDRTLILKDKLVELETMSAYVKEVDILLKTKKQNQRGQVAPLIIGKNYNCNDE